MNETFDVLYAKLYLRYNKLRKPKGENLLNMNIGYSGVPIIGVFTWRFSYLLSTPVNNDHKMC